MRFWKKFWPILIVLLSLGACEKQRDEQAVETPTPVTITQTGWLDIYWLDEASGLQASHAHEGDFFVHNDEGEPIIFAIDESGSELGYVTIVPAKNKDWEDITSVPVDNGRWLVIGDIGDNQSKRKSIRLYFIDEPKTGRNNRYGGDAILKHWINLTYPDGPRDCESMAYDPINNQILFLSKRDRRPQLYAIDLETALTQEQATLQLLGTTHPLRRPTPADRAQWGGRVDWISQPTGMDISADGTELSIITYRSLYRYKRNQGEDWLTTMQRRPDEVVGPPAVQNEAISYSIDGKAIFVTTEKRPTPLHKVIFTDVIGTE